MFTSQAAPPASEGRGQNLSTTSWIPELEAYGAARPDVLYHYTSMSGLEGILESGSLWATSIRELNDPSEFEYTLRSFEGQLATGRPPGLCASWVAVRDLLTSSDSTVFVTSLSSLRDHLGQWRAYAAPPDGFAGGYGYSLGIKADFLASCARRQSFGLTRCVYDVDLQQRAISTVLAWQELPFAFGDEGPSPYLTREELLDFAADVFQLAPRLKNPVFAEEGEWRLVSSFCPIRDEGTCFRTASQELVPFVNFFLSDGGAGLGLAEIIAGPSPDPPASIAHVRGLLQKHGVKDCAVVESIIPYRARPRSARLTPAD